MSAKPRESILVVDDESAIVNVIREYFEFKGYTVLTAGNGREALQALKKNSVDCCFTDINMPEMNGLELAEYIHEHDNAMPVVIMTGYPSLDNAIRTLKNGVVDFLIKPVQLDQMEISLRRVLHERKLFAENLLLKKEVEGKQRLQRLNRELTHKVTQLQTLNKILFDFSAIDSTADVFNRSVQLAREITRAEAVSFYVINEAVQQPVAIAVSAGSDFSADAAPEVTEGTPPSGSMAGVGTDLILEVASDRVPLLVPEDVSDRGAAAGFRSLILAPLEIRRTVFGVIAAETACENSPFTQKDLFYLNFISQSAARAIENLALYENIYENLFATLYAFVEALDVRDAYTKQHSSRVAGIAMALGRELGCSAEEIDNLYFAGHLHDIGKIGIRDDVLLKDGPLTPEEFAKIKEHPSIGGKIVGQLGLWDAEQLIIRSHHERYDGKGYPDGLEGEEIPFLARILSVADVFDAMASGRTYRAKIPQRKILQLIREGAGTQFDAKIAAVFLDLYHSGKLDAFIYRERPAVS